MTWHPVPADLGEQDDWSPLPGRSRVDGYFWTWRRLCAGTPVSRRKLAEYMGCGTTTARSILDRCRKDWEAHEKKAAPMSGYQKAKQGHPNSAPRERPKSAPGEDSDSGDLGEDSAEPQPNSAPTPPIHAGVPSCKGKGTPIVQRFLALTERWSGDDAPPDRRWLVKRSRDLDWWLGKLPGWADRDVLSELDRIDNWLEGQARTMASGRKSKFWTPSGWKSGITGWMKRAKPSATAPGAQPTNDGDLDRLWQWSLSALSKAPDRFRADIEALPPVDRDAIRAGYQALGGLGSCRDQPPRFVGTKARRSQFIEAARPHLARRQQLQVVT